MKHIRMGPSNAVLDEYDQPLRVDDWVIEDRAGEREFTARLIGIGTSRREQHSHGTTPLNGASGQALFDAYRGQQRCTACRWSEIYVFKVSDRDHNVPPGARYCVYTLGPSVIPGENTRANVRWATSGFEVVELCTVRRGERGAPFLPAAHARALAMAANVDDDVADAYVNRAVA